MPHARHILAVLLLLMATGCARITEAPPRFERMAASHTGIDFRNELRPTESFNMYIFRNFYNGGGVAVGDVDGDALPDVFFTGNMVSNRLYRNLGDLRFEDVTLEAGLQSDGAWSTGASFADVDADGDLDLFVALSGPPEGPNRTNRLYLNRGDGTFEDGSAQWGVDHLGLGTSAVFFDADGDSRLDLLLLSNPVEPLGAFNDARGEQRTERGGGDLRFYRNAGDRFVESTEAAGFLSNRFSFPLSASLTDLDGDGDTDVYLANDFFERDYLYLNDGQGRFTEVFTEPMVRSSSLSSMGSDVADLDGDGRPDLYVSDMRPASERRLKSKMPFETFSEQQEQSLAGFGQQHTRNTLFLNVAEASVNGDEAFHMAEVSRLTATESTDWSWAVLLADFDLNGWNDIFVTNGIGKDLLDLDYLQWTSDPSTIARRVAAGERRVILDLLDRMDSEPLANALFANRGELEFVESASAWGLGEPGFSSGAAWGDLDADGDLDLVVNDTDGEARIYRNRTVDFAAEGRGPANWLRVDLRGHGGNTLAIGAKVTAWVNGRPQLREAYLQRGFQSSVEPGLFFGFGEATRLDSVVVEWPTGVRSVIDETERLTLPTRLTLEEPEMAPEPLPTSKPEPESARSPAAQGLSGAPPTLASTASPVGSPRLRQLDPTELGIGFVHRDFGFDDFRREPLLFHMRSTEGPALCSGDVDGDGRLDVYIGGARGQGGRLYLQTPEGRFRSVFETFFDAEQTSEEVDCAFFDANSDGRDDLYVVSGGNSLASASTALSDRMVLSFPAADPLLASLAQTEPAAVSDPAPGVPVRLYRSPAFLPTSRTFESTSVVSPHDFTGDGIIDLFVGTRLRPFSVGLPVSGYLLEGDGAGGFRDVTEAWAPVLREIGMITHALWVDLDGDGAAELAVTGEYMPIRVFTPRNGRFEETTGSLGLQQTSGWWNRLLAGDWNGDGRMDLIGLNHGRNSLFRATPEDPVSLWVGDFSGDGLVEHILAVRKGGRDYTVALKHDLAAQIPVVGQRFPTYAEFAGRTVQEIFSRQELDAARLLQAVELRSMRFLQSGTGPAGGADAPSAFSPMLAEPLPLWAQVSPMYAAALLHDPSSSRQAVLLGGNLYAVKPQVGSYDASRGVVVDPATGREIPETGFSVQGEVREILPIRLGTAERPGLTLVLVARYDMPPAAFLTEWVP